MPLGAPTQMPSQMPGGPRIPRRDNPGPNPTVQPTRQNPTGLAGSMTIGAGAAGGAAGSRPVDPLIQWYNGTVAQAQAQWQQAQTDGLISQTQADERYYSGIRGLNANAGFDRAYLANDRARLSADYGLATAKDANLNDQFMLSQRRFNDQLGQNQDRRGLAGRQFDLTRAGADNQFRSNIDAALLQFDRTTRAQRSDATARGATLTPGYGDDQIETRRARDLANRDARDGRDQTIAGATLTRDATFNDLAYADRANQRTYDTDTSNYKMAQEQQKRERAYLDNLAADYGVKAEQIEDALRRGAENLGLSWDETKFALAQQTRQNSDAALAAGSAATMQLLAASGSGIGGGGMSGMPPRIPAPRVSPTPTIDQITTTTDRIPLVGGIVRDMTGSGRVGQVGPVFPKT